VVLLTRPQPQPKPGWDPTLGPLIGHLTDGLKTPQAANPADGGLPENMPPLARMTPQIGPEVASYAFTQFPKGAWQAQERTGSARQDLLEGKVRRFPGFYQGCLSLSEHVTRSWRPSSVGTSSGIQSLGDNPGRGLLSPVKEGYRRILCSCLRQGRKMELLRRRTRRKESCQGRKGRLAWFGKAHPSHKQSVARGTLPSPARRFSPLEAGTRL
jgi:hypothetical protein